MTLSSEAVPRARAPPCGSFDGARRGAELEGRRDDLAISFRMTFLLDRSPRCAP